MSANEKLRIKAYDLLSAMESYTNQVGGAVWSFRELLDLVCAAHAHKAESEWPTPAKLLIDHDPFMPTDWSMLYKRDQTAGVLLWRLLYRAADRHAAVTAAVGYVRGMFPSY